MTDRPAIIVVANSARALASSAKRAGFDPLSIDVFGDDDLRQASVASVKLEGGLSEGLRREKVVGAVEALISAYDPIGLVYGAGFEREPEAIDAIARKTRVFGNEAEALKRAKDPRALARLCAVIGVPHPAIAFAAPDDPERWLVKAEGGAGGAHIAVATDLRPGSSDRYFQRRVAGQGISALFVSDGKEADIIGFSLQWTAPTRAAPFRYGGAAGPIEVGAANAEVIARSVAAVASELGLVGLNSIDFLVSDDVVWLIEINPRPGATLDVFEPSENALFAHHVAACEGHLKRVAMGSGFKAAAVVYSPCDVKSPIAWNWPDWTVDRPPPSAHIAAGDPLCTALASGTAVDLARSSANERARTILAVVREWEQ
jgi:predicted ATP-grasp superfamily ATP-dependent carboligase